ncbi:MAG TPA: DUF2127 domain-containing protein, partial [Candidatus Paceibacterota bacterium]|nr:DUF2127 domain-containing protein [Candidatus Paceibacterota bacterium]
IGKALFALAEIAGGIAAYFVTRHFLLNLVLLFTQQEVIEDPQDAIAHYLLVSAQSFSVSTQHFVALFLLSHGLIKMFIIVGLLRKRLWYYPTGMVVFGLFIVYQLYRYSFTHSVWLLLITLLDVLVLLLTWHEYGYLKSHPTNRVPQVGL